jgi:hypothetical protein
MKKITTILVCALALMVAFSLNAAPKKKVTKKKAKTTKVVKSRPGLEMPTDRGADAAVASSYSNDKSIEELIAAAVGKEGTKQPIRNLIANDFFVQRSGIAPLMEQIGGLSGSAYKFNHNGTDFYMVKFSNVFIDPYREDVILFVPSTNNIIRCRCMNSENMEILSKEKDFDIEASDVQQYYDSTFVI